MAALPRSMSGTTTLRDETGCLRCPDTSGRLGPGKVPSELRPTARPALPVAMPIRVDLLAPGALLQLSTGGGYARQQPAYPQPPAAS